MLRLSCRTQAEPISVFIVRHHNGLGRICWRCGWSLTKHTLTTKTTNGSGNITGINDARWLPWVHGLRRWLWVWQQRQGGLGCGLTGITICFRNNPVGVTVNELELSDNAGN